MIPIDILPEEFRESWCVAGGYAACPALANDIDVWVYGRHNLVEARQTILDYLKLFRYSHKVEELSEVLEASDHYGNLVIKIEKVARLQGPDKPIHIMVTDAPEPALLISAFDISTHAVAIGYSGKVYTAADYTHPGQTPRLMVHANVNTPARMEKIMARFGHLQEGAYGEAAQG